MHWSTSAHPVSLRKIRYHRFCLVAIADNIHANMKEQEENEKENSLLQKGQN